MGFGAKQGFVVPSSVEGITLRKQATTIVAKGNQPTIAIALVLTSEAA